MACTRIVPSIGSTIIIPSPCDGGGGDGAPWLYTATAPPLAASWTQQGGTGVMTDVTGGSLRLTLPAAATRPTWWTRAKPAAGAGGWVAELGSIPGWAGNPGGAAASVGIGVSDGVNAFTTLAGGGFVYVHGLHVMATGAYLGNGGYGALAGDPSAGAFNVQVWRETLAATSWRSGRMDGPGPVGAESLYGTVMSTPNGLGVASTLLSIVAVQTADTNLGTIANVFHYREGAVP